MLPKQSKMVNKSTKRWFITIPVSFIKINMNGVFNISNEDDCPTEIGFAQAVY